MTDTAKRAGGPLWLIVPGAVVFIFALAVSAAFEADLRGLHFFQAWLYVATVVLSRRGNRWGYFIGIATALLWDYALAFTRPPFATTPFPVVVLENPMRPDVLLQTLAWFGNVSIIAGGVWGYVRLQNRVRRDAARFGVAFVGCIGFLYTIVAVFTPERLTLFPALLHPHWP